MEGELLAAHPFPICKEMRVAAPWRVFFPHPINHPTMSADEQMGTLQPLSPLCRMPIQDHSQVSHLLSLLSRSYLRLTKCNIAGNNRNTLHLQGRIFKAEFCFGRYIFLLTICRHKFQHCLSNHCTCFYLEIWNLDLQWTAARKFLPPKRKSSWGQV